MVTRHKPPFERPQQGQLTLAARVGHYMPPMLLQSQLDTLQPPAAGENALVLDLALPPEQLVAAVVRHLEITSP